MSIESKRQDLIDLGGRRERLLEEANAAYEAGNHEESINKTTEAKALGDKMVQLRDMIREEERELIQDAAPQSHADRMDMANERGKALMRGEKVTFDTREVQRQLMNDVTLATGTIAKPTEVGTTIRDPYGLVVSSILDQVYVSNLTGMGAMMEPYLIEGFDATGGNVEANAGKPRATSDDPKFGVAKISPYEVTTTNFVDRNISKLTPIDYYAKVEGLAIQALRRKVAALIVNGDGQAAPDMFGMKNALNVAGNKIYDVVVVAGIDENLFDELYFAYGSDAALGPNGRVLLTKSDLKAIGRVRNRDVERIFTVTPNAGDPNTGVIYDGGNAIPYTIVPDLTPLAGATSGGADTLTIGYGDPMNYELALFGNYSIRVDDSVKSIERMTTILGDVFVGGNLIRHKGMVWAKVAADTASAAKAGGNK